MTMFDARPIALVLMALTWVGCQKVDPQAPDAGVKLYNNCKDCHGAAGLGMPEYGAPAIAGLQAWYVEAQVTKFQTGARGAHADDTEGMRMRALSKSLLTPEHVKAVADYVSKLEPAKQSKTVMDGDPGRGAALFKPCEACHGADGAGMDALNAPALRYSNDWYLLRQLQKFKSGVRGRGPGDMTGMQMAAMVASLPDEQAMKDVVAYIQKLK